MSGAGVEEHGRLVLARHEELRLNRGYVIIPVDRNADQPCSRLLLQKGLVVEDAQPALRVVLVHVDRRGRVHLFVILFGWSHALFLLSYCGSISS